MNDSGRSLKALPGLQLTIQVQAGPNKGEVYRILPPGAIVGRDPQSCQVILMDARVSRQQFRLDYKMEGITIEDLSSKKTTLINSQTINGEHLLRHGDVIFCGDSQLQLEIKSDDVSSSATSPAATAPQTLSPLSAISSYIPQGALPQNGHSAVKPNQRLYFIIGLGIVAALILWMIPENPPQPPPKVATSETIDESIVAVQKRQEELQKSLSKMSELDIYNKRSAQKHFIRGFRDYQNGRYTRAMEAFQTALATDRTHTMARRYYKLAEKKRLDDVDYHMDLGVKYKDKAMYKMCIAEFQQVLQILNQPNNKKYQLAKEQMKECRLSIQEGS